MSFYATIVGEIRYKRQSDFEAAIGVLKNDGWLNEDDHLVDEIGAKVTDDQPNVDRGNRVIRFPYAFYRNLSRALEELFAGGSGKVVWASTDGCFDGGVIVDGTETAYDLEVWNQSNRGVPPPVPAEDHFDEYVEWQEQVQDSFFGRFEA